MFAKFLVRSLFVTFLLGSVVACTFEGTEDESEGQSSSQIKGGKGSSDEDAGPAPCNDVDAAVDAGSGGDAEVDAGPWDDNDAGFPDDSDAGWDDDNDGGAWGGSDAGSAWR